MKCVLVCINVSWNFVVGTGTIKFPVNKILQTRSEEKHLNLISVLKLICQNVFQTFNQSE